MAIAKLGRHVRRQLGNSATRPPRALKAIATPLKAVNHGSAPDVDVNAIIRLLINNLAESFICFGVGPRWRANRISTLFSERMAHH
jgi:hypothetical protein